jgi:hypothetical protein
MEEALKEMARHHLRGKCLANDWIGCFYIIDIETGLS